MWGKPRREVRQRPWGMLSVVLRHGLSEVLLEDVSSGAGAGLLLSGCCDKPTQTGGTRQQELIFLSSWRLVSEIQGQDRGIRRTMLPAEGSRAESSLCLLQPLEAASLLRLVATSLHSLPPWSHSLPLSVHSPRPPSIWGYRQWRVGPTWITQNHLPTFKLTDAQP